MEYMAAQMDRQIEGAQLAYDEALEAGRAAAFPSAPDQQSGREYGVTVRDYFAAKAMHAMISTAGAPCLLGLEGDEHYTAKAAYKMADAMLASRAFLCTA
ncbi:MULTISPECIES: hypothetical protein [unclassified Pseudomonas]|uniref:hypothetical protein n=1 Tax=unclassified Pseudomonas TaxID=196821 RepID=UPI0018E7AFCD|nr:MULTISPECIES: hypothetical protein [unclassified Pseudomonas]MBJ2303881.1 hypothetical protein [Pseudomonas sp. MF2846]MBK3492254.1 hypothetical protein [Pseudomonas sp. MF2857]